MWAERTWQTMRARSKRADGRTGADEEVGRTSGRADGAQEARTRGRAKEALMGGLAVGAGRAAVWRTGRTGGLGVRWSGGRAVKRIGSPLVGRMGGQAGGPWFKWPHSTRPISLLGAWSACLIRVQGRRVPGSAVGSSTIPRQTPVLSDQIHLPRLSASVLGALKGILLFRYKNGFT